MIGIKGGHMSKKVYADEILMQDKDKKSVRQVLLGQVTRLMKLIDYGKPVEQLSFRLKVVV
jgi:hypothetical protein